MTLGSHWRTEMTPQGQGRARKTSRDHHRAGKSPGTGSQGRRLRIEGTDGMQGRASCHLLSCGARSQPPFLWHKCSIVSLDLTCDPWSGNR